VHTVNYRFSIYLLRATDRNLPGILRDLDQFSDVIGAPNRELYGLVFVSVLGIDLENDRADWSVLKDRASVLGRVENRIVVVDVVNQNLKGCLGDLELNGSNDLCLGK